MSLDRITWRETASRLRADRQRLRARIIRQEQRAPAVLALHPSYLCVRLYRISNYFYRAGHRWVARFFWHLNTLVTGADISPPSDLGEGLVIVSPAGVAITADSGRNLTVMPLAGIGSEIARRLDIGAGPGIPVLGDDVILEPHAGVLGPIRVGDRVRVAAGALVLKDVPADTVVEGPPVRFLKRSDRA